MCRLLSILSCFLYRSFSDFDSDRLDHVTTPEFSADERSSERSGRVEKMQLLQSYLQQEPDDKEEPDDILQDVDLRYASE